MRLVSNFCFSIVFLVSNASDFVANIDLSSDNEITEVELPVDKGWLEKEQGVAVTDGADHHGRMEQKAAAASMPSEMK